MSLRCDSWANAGTEVTLELPGADGPVEARTVRSDNGVLGLTSRQDDGVVSQVDRALDHIGRGPRAAA